MTARKLLAKPQLRQEKNKVKKFIFEVLKPICFDDGNIRKRTMDSNNVITLNLNDLMEVGNTVVWPKILKTDEGSFIEVKNPKFFFFYKKNYLRNNKNYFWWILRGENENFLLHERSTVRKLFSIFFSFFTKGNWTKLGLFGS